MLIANLQTAAISSSSHLHRRVPAGGKRAHRIPRGKSRVRWFKRRRWRVWERRMPVKRAKRRESSRC